MGGFGDEAADGVADFFGDERAFYGEKEKYGAIGIRKGFIIALALGNDEICVGEAPAEIGRAILQNGSGRIGAIVEHGCDFGNSGGPGVIEGCVVEDGGAANANGNPAGREALEQESVEINFAGVVGQIEDGASAFGGLKEGWNVAAKRMGPDGFKMGRQVFGGDLDFGADVEQVSADGDANGGLARVGMGRDAHLHGGNEACRHLVHAGLGCPEGIGIAKFAPNGAMQTLGHCGRRAGPIAVGDFPEQATKELFPSYGVCNRFGNGIEGLAGKARDAIERGVQGGQCGGWRQRILQRASVMRRR